METHYKKLMKILSAVNIAMGLVLSITAHAGKTNHDPRFVNYKYLGDNERNLRKLRQLSAAGQSIGLFIARTPREKLPSHDLHHPEIAGGEHKTVCASLCPDDSFLEESQVSDDDRLSFYVSDVALKKLKHAPSTEFEHQLNQSHATKHAELEAIRRGIFDQYEKQTLDKFEEVLDRVYVRSSVKWYNRDIVDDVAIWTVKH